MRKHSALSLLAAFIVLGLSGCPGETGLGAWKITFDGGLTVVGLDFKSSGSVATVDVGTFTNLAGTLTWVRISETEILIRQDISGDRWVHYGLLASDTMMSGGQLKVVGTGAGEGFHWTAVKI